MFLKLNWNIYAILVIASIIGSIAILPYAFALASDQLVAAPLSTTQLVASAVIQGTILFSILTLVGMLAASRVGLSIISQPSSYPAALLFGLIAGGAVIALELLIFRRFLPPEMQTVSQNIEGWKSIIAILYGAVNEEVMTRLFLMSGLVWLLQLLPAAASAHGGFNGWVFWLAIIVASLIFGLGHLPATAAITPLTPPLIVRALILNGLPGLIFGWIYWQSGLTAAMAAHFAADIVLRGFELFN